MAKFAKQLFGELVGDSHWQPVYCTWVKGCFLSKTRGHALLRSLSFVLFQRGLLSFLFQLFVNLLHTLCGKRVGKYKYCRDAGDACGYPADEVT